MKGERGMGGRGRGGMRREGAGSHPKLTLVPHPQNYFPGAGAAAPTA